MHPKMSYCRHKEAKCKTCGVCRRCPAGEGCDSTHVPRLIVQDTLSNLGRKKRVLPVEEELDADHNDDNDYDMEKEDMAPRYDLRSKTKTVPVSEEELQQPVRPYFARLCESLGMTEKPSRVTGRTSAFTAEVLSSSDGESRYSGFLYNLFQHVAAFVCPGGGDQVWHLLDKYRDRADLDYYDEAVALIADFFCRSTQEEVKRVELAKLYALLKSEEKVKAALLQAMQRREQELHLAPPMVIQGVGRVGKRAALDDLGDILAGKTLTPIFYSSRVSNVALMHYCEFATQFFDGLES